jgi:acetolactate synthase-1/2/3 large subunit
MNSHRGADLLAATLKAAGVTRIFTLSGNHIMPVFDAALDAGIELVHTRHEAACVHMADAYARLTGTPAVAMVTGGPGHANAVSALYTARMGEAPIVLLSGHAPNDQADMGAFQEMAQAAMAAPVCKAAWNAADADSLGVDMLRALATAAAGRPGPVNLNLPTDALEGTTRVATPAAPANAQNTFDDAAARAAMDWLSQGARPLILAGAVSLTPAGRPLLTALEDACGIPVVGMESPRGVADPSLGAFAEVLAQADRVLLVGKRVDFTLKFGRALSADALVLQLDPEAEERARAARAFGARLTSSLDAAPLAALRALASATTRKGSAAWFDEVGGAIRHRPAAWQTAQAGQPHRLHPMEVCRPLQTLLDSHPDSVLVSDGGEFGQWAQACLAAPTRIINGAAGAIGPALPFALGARMARPGVPIVALMGDGTFGFHAMEIDTAMRHRLDFVAVVGNDARWNAEYQIQLKSYGAARTVGCSLEPSRYDFVAASFGAYGEMVEDPGRMADAVARARASGRPALLNVMIEGLAAPQVTRKS